MFHRKANHGDWITVVTNATGTFTGEMTLPDGKVIPPTAKAFDLEFAQTSKWDGDQLKVISASGTQRCKPNNSDSTSNAARLKERSLR